MNKILITIFVILLVPFVGLPSEFDQWLYGLLGIILLYFLYTFLKQIRKKEVIQNSTKITKENKGMNMPQSTVKKEKIKDDTTQISKKDKEDIKKAIKDSK